MNAAVLHGKEDVRIEQVEPRGLQPGEVRLSIGAAMTCGTDLKVYKRGYHARMIVPPAVFGHEMAGTLEEIHPSVTAWSPGDRVVVANSAPCGECYYCQRSQENLCDDLLFLNGAYAESIVIPSRLVQKNLCRLNSDTAFSDAALTEPLACVVKGMDDLQVQKGESVLIIGSGPIALFFVVLAHAEGARVTLVGRGQARLAKAAALGAEMVLDIGLGSVEDRIKPHPVLYDVVIEAVGKPETWQAAVGAVRKGGRVNLFGGCPSGTSITLDTGLVHYSNLTLLASFHHTPRAIRRALELIESGVIRGFDFVSESCALTKLPQLFREMAETNRAVKTLIRVND